MPAGNGGDRIRELLRQQRPEESWRALSENLPAPERPSGKYVPFDETIPSLGDIATPVYEADPEMPYGERGLTFTPPPRAPARGSRASVAAAHQRRMGK